MLSGKQSAHQVSQCVFLALEEEGHIELLHLRVCVCEHDNIGSAGHNAS